MRIGPELHLRVESAPLSGRLQACSRYVALLAEQLEALERGEMLRAQALDDGREGLQREADAAGAAHGFQDLLRTGLQELKSRMEIDQRMREIWSDLRDRAYSSARALPARPVTGGQYPETTRVDARVDLRL